MVSDELQSLRDEARGADPAASPELPAVDSDNPAALVTAAGRAIMIGGNAMCARYGVTPLEQGEADMLGAALLDVARVYGLLDRADPRIMSLVTLGGTVAVVLGNRKRLPPPPSPKPEPAQHAAT